MEAKISFDMVEKANEEMRELLEQFPVEQPKDIQQTLTQLETRSLLLKKAKKVTMAQLSTKNSM